MKSAVGLWIDHRKAVVVRIIDKLEEIKVITSNVDKHIRFSGEAQKQAEEDQQDRRFRNQLNQFYDGVISFLRDAESILIIGPGKAKLEFKKRLETETQSGRIVGLETVDKMTDNQIVARVKGYFAK
ncbi:MAG: hypothetical protein Q8S39_08495 [Ignavibacteria bacterium]|nr:hypothetical protein [Ignavibacteria bacterium]